MVDLLKHNQEAYEKIKSAITDGQKKIAIAHATGTGKSYLIAKLFEDYNNDKKLVLVPSTYISDQIQALFKKYHIQNVEVILYQKLIKMSDEDIDTMDYSVIALDEYHHDTSKVWGEKVRKLIDTHPESIIFGTSATPIRSDGINTIDELFEGNCASDLPLSESIAKKIVPLPKYVGALYTLDDELQKLRQKVENATNTSEEKQEFYKKINTMRSQIEKSYGMPIILNKHIKNKEGKYIIFCKRKRHLREIKDTVIGWFKMAGFKDINAYEVYSDYENKDAEYKAFCDDTSHALKLLFCVNMLNEGLHLENISGVLLLRPTRSSIVWHQQIGRAIEANNTNTPVIIDAVNNFSAVGQGMELMREIKDAVAREKESDPDFDDGGFEDIDTFFVVEQVVEIQEMFKAIEGRLEGREWTEEENEILKRWYPVEGLNVIDRLEGRTKDAIKTHVSKFGLKIRSGWTEEENNILREYYLVEGTKVIDRLSGRTKRAIMAQANQLGIKKLKNCSIWTKEEIDILKKYYPVEGTKVIDKLERRTKETIAAMASKLGIKTNNYWTDEEIEILKKRYPKYGSDICNSLPNKTKAMIRNKAHNLKISIKERGIFTKEEDEIIKKYYPVEGSKVHKRLNNKTQKQCIGRAQRLGINKDIRYMYKRGNKYIVEFTVNGKSVRFGTFDSEEEAAKVAMQKAKEYGKAI